MTDLTPRRPHVRLTRLALQDFRNYATLQLRLDGRHVCLYGANGSGKTNLMEAVSMLSPGRGLRGAEFTDLIRRDADGQLARSWAISSDVRDGDIDRKLALSLEMDEQGRSKRTARLDGVNTTQNDLGEPMRIIWLTPSMDRVFAGPAGDRRRFLDRQVLAHFPSHASAGAAYEKAMRQRNVLLERGRADPVWLDALELGMASAGAAMAIHRIDAVKVMQEAILARPEGAFPKALIDLDGAFETHAANGVALTDIEQEIAVQLRENRSRDQAAGRTTQGVHRTDLRVFHAPKGLPADRHHERDRDRGGVAHDLHELLVQQSAEAAEEGRGRGHAAAAPARSASCSRISPTKASSSVGSGSSAVTNRCFIASGLPEAIIRPA